MSPELAQSVQGTNRIFEQEVAGKKNIDALDRVYTANARILPPGTEMVSGRENIKNFWRAAIDALHVTAVRLETVDFELQGDTGVEIGRATLELAGGTTAVGKYVVVWKQEDGAWKWHVDVWNMNA